MAEAPDHPALALLRLELLTPLTEIRGEMTELRGDVRLILQRLDQADERAAAQANELRRHDERLDALERTAVTKADIDRRIGRTIQVLSVIATVLGIVAGAVTNIITA